MASNDYSHQRSDGNLDPYSIKRADGTRVRTLHTLVINNHAPNARILCYDSANASAGPLIADVSLHDAAPAPVALRYDVKLKNGLAIEVINNSDYFLDFTVTCS